MSLSPEKETKIDEVVETLYQRILKGSTQQGNVYQQSEK
jgi:hypothetical protein